MGTRHHWDATGPEVSSEDDDAVRIVDGGSAPLVWADLAAGDSDKDGVTPAVVAEGIPGAMPGYQGPLPAG